MTTEKTTSNDDSRRITASFIKQRYDKFSAVPRDGVFTANAVPLRPPVCQEAVDRGLFAIIDSYDGHASRVRGNVYMMTEDTENLLEEYEPMSSKMPCGHHDGFRNEVGSSYLKCKGCGGRFTKEEIMEVRNE